jgi:RNA polymerase subunit RPABC4/transcription elongation factor Spt4
MALVACPECNKEISSTAPSCPHCGATPRKTGMSGGFIFVLVVLVLFVIGVIIS